MDDGRCNGWKNHATWCVHLHVNNTEHAQRYAEQLAKHGRDLASESEQVESGTWTIDETERFTVADSLKTWIETTVEDATRHTDDFGQLLVSDLVGRYLCEVDWDEIARAFLEVND